MDLEERRKKLREIQRDLARLWAKAHDERMSAEAREFFWSEFEKKEPAETYWLSKVPRERRQ